MPADETPRILLVEDSGIVRHLVAQVLAEEGYVVDQATSVEEALNYLGAVEIVVTDVDLGDGASGVELIGEIRTRFPQLQVVAMSGMPALLRRASLAGADAVLPKPFELDQLRVVMTVARLAVEENYQRIAQPPNRKRRND
jgi:CheY-like chemotaxis protein